MIFLKSQIPDDFEEQIRNYVEAMMLHRFTKNVPAPKSSVEVEAAVRRVKYPIKAKKPDDFVPDYEIVDDIPPPPPPPTLEQRKEALSISVLRSEQELVQSKAPSIAQQRANSIRSMDIFKAGGPQTEDDAQFIANMQNMQAGLDTLHRSVSQILLEIEGLSESAINTYIPPALTL